MKKTIRFLLILVAVIVAIVLILALVEPSNVSITCTTMIKAPKETVFEQMVLFKNWPNWSPWEHLDSSMKKTYSGTDGTPGSSYAWESNNKDVGSGSMTNKGVSGTQIDINLEFLKPFKSQAEITLKAEDTAGMTKASWSFTTHMPFPMNAMLAFVDMKKKLGDDFEKGLATMKSYVESHPTAGGSGSMDIKEVDFPAHIYEGVRQVVAWNDMKKFFGDTYGMLGKGMGPKITGPATGLYYTWDTVNKNSDMVACFPAYDTTMPVNGASFVHLGPSKAYMVVYKGPYGNEMEVHNALRGKVAAEGKHQSVVVEEYLIGPGKEPDSTKWVTNIYYLVQ